MTFAKVRSVNVKKILVFGIPGDQRGMWIEAVDDLGIQADYGWDGTGCLYDLAFINTICILDFKALPGIDMLTCPLIGVTPGARDNHPDPIFAGHLISPFNTSHLNAIYCRFGKGGPKSILRQEILNGLIEFDGGRGNLKRYFDLMETSVAGHLTELATVIDRGDTDQIIYRAHSINSAVANCGAERVREVCRLLENGAAELTPDAKRSLLARLRHEYYLLRKVLAQEGVI